VFKLTKSGYLIGNSRYIKTSDERGPVNIFPSAYIKNMDLGLMDSSVSIPYQLVLRSLPINLEVVELLVDAEFLESNSDREEEPNDYSAPLY